MNKWLIGAAVYASSLGLLIAGTWTYAEFLRLRQCERVAILAARAEQLADIFQAEFEGRTDLNPDVLHPLMLESQEVGREIQKGVVLCVGR